MAMAKVTISVAMTLDLTPRAWRGFSQSYRENLPCVALRGFWDVLSIWELSGLVFDLIVYSCQFSNLKIAGPGGRSDRHLVSLLLAHQAFPHR